MTKNNIYNSLFHRCVNGENEVRDVVEVYNSPFPELPYDKTTIENPLYKYMGIDEVEPIIKFGEYNGTPIKWRVLYYDAPSHNVPGIVLLSEYILEERVFDNHDPNTNVWENSSLRDYLNNAFYNDSFTEWEKEHIQEVETDHYVHDKVFLLSGTMSSLYFYGWCSSLGDINERLAKYHGVYTPWWLRTPGDTENTCQMVYNVPDDPQNYARYVYNPCGVRPVIVVSLNTYRSTINPFYGQTIWGRLTNPDPEDSDKFMLSVSDPFSTHNQKPQSVDKDLYKRIKSDFAIFIPPVSGSTYSFNYVFKNEIITKEISTSGDVPDGIYLTAKCIFIKENDDLYQTGYADINSSMEQLFLSKFEKTTTLPGKSVYASCWADLDPRIELYLPVYEDIGNGSSNKFYRWLGERFDKTEDNDTLFKGIVIYHNEQFI